MKNTSTHYGTEIIHLQHDRIKTPGENIRSKLQTSKGTDSIARFYLSKRTHTSSIVTKLFIHHKQIQNY